MTFKQTCLCFLAYFKDFLRGRERVIKKEGREERHSDCLNCFFLIPNCLSLVNPNFITYIAFQAVQLHSYLEQRMNFGQYSEGFTNKVNSSVA